MSEHIELQNDGGLDRTLLKAGHCKPYSNRGNDPAERDHQSKLGLLPLKWAVTGESKDY